MPKLSNAISSLFFSFAAVTSAALFLTPAPALGATGGKETATIAPATAQNAPVITWTYLKAHPGHVEQLASFIRKNWFAMDQQAVRAGLFKSYRLLQNSESGADQDWDLIVEVSYHDAAGYAGVQREFEAIRAKHIPVKIDGKDLPQLGRVVRSHTVFDAS